MCDWCCGPAGDRDKPYEFDRPDQYVWRFTDDELRVLEAFRAHANDVKAGYQHGHAYGDISSDDPICPSCGQQCHLHEPIGLCNRG